jgi:hypothetical protein
MVKGILGIFGAFKIRAHNGWVFMLLSSLSQLLNAQSLNGQRGGDQA